MYKKVAVLTLRGKLMGPPETHELYDSIVDLTENGVTRIALDLSHVNWMNSLGLGAIMKCLTLISKVDGQLHLVGLTDKVRSVFVMSQLTKLFKIHEEVDQAVEVLNRT